MLRTVVFTTVWPGDCLEVDVLEAIIHHDGLLAVEPHLPGSVASILHSVWKQIRIANFSCDPVNLREHEHF